MTIDRLSFVHFNSNSPLLCFFLGNSKLTKIICMGGHTIISTKALWVLHCLLCLSIQSVNNNGPHVLHKYQWHTFYNYNCCLPLTQTCMLHWNANIFHILNGVCIVSISRYTLHSLYVNNRELHRMENITISPILSHFAETIQGVATIRAYNQESRFMEMLFKRMEANNITVIMQNASNRWLGIALVSNFIPIWNVSMGYMWHTLLAPNKYWIEDKA